MPHSITTGLWDVIATPSGMAIIIIQPSPRPRQVTIDNKGCSIETDGATICLEDSHRIANVVATARVVIVAEADERTTRETVVMTLDRREALKGAIDDRKAA